MKWFWGLIAITIASLFDGCAHVRDLSLETSRYIAPERAYVAEMPGEHPKDAVAINVGVDIGKLIRWDSRVHATTTSAQYRLVGLEFTIGPRIFDQVDVLYYHHSQHLLDRSQEPGSHFPVEDAVVIRWNLIHSL